MDSLELTWELITYPKFVPLSLASLLIGFISSYWILNRFYNGNRWPVNAWELFAFATFHLLGVGAADFLILTEKPTPSSVGLMAVHISFFVLLSLRLTSSLIPLIWDQADLELYIENIKYFDRAVLNIGIGVVVALLFTLTPDGSSLLFRFSLIVLLGPIAALIIGIIGIGALRIKSAQKLLFERR